MDSEKEEAARFIVFDNLHGFDTEYKDYKKIKSEFKQNKVKFDKKRLKNAIIYDNNLLPNQEEAMST